MKFFTVLLLASLASASLTAVLSGPEGETPLKTQNTDTTAQFTPTSHASREHASSEDPSKAPFIFSEEVISTEDVVIESPKSKTPSTLQEKLKSAALQQEETAGLTPTAATTSEGKLAEFGHAVGTKLDKMVKALTNVVKDMIPGPSGILKP